MTTYSRYTSWRHTRRLALSAAFGIVAAGALSLAALAPASAQTPQLVTNPDGSVSYVTAANGSALVATGGGTSYINGSGGAQLITNPDGSVSYANVNGGPSLVVGPNGQVSYQNVIAGSNGYQSTLGYSTSGIDIASSGGSTPLTTGMGVNPLIPTGQVLPPAAVTLSVGGSYCSMAGGGQIWVPTGAPSSC